MEALRAEARKRVERHDVEAREDVERIERAAWAEVQRLQMEVDQSRRQAENAQRLAGEAQDAAHHWEHEVHRLQIECRESVAAVERHKHALGTYAPIR